MNIKQWKCPKCGETTSAEPRRYRNGEVVYFHDRVLKRGPVPHYEVTKHCTIQPSSD